MNCEMKGTRRLATAVATEVTARPSVVTQWSSRRRHLIVVVELVRFPHCVHGRGP